MKKFLALLLAAVLAITLVPMASAIVITPDIEDDTFDEEIDDFEFRFDGDTFETLISAGEGFVGVPNEGGNYFLLEDGNDKYTLSASVTSSNPGMINASIVRSNKTVDLYEEELPASSSELNEADDSELDASVLGATSRKVKAARLVLKLNPADEYFTVQEHEVKIKLVIVQKKSVSGSKTLKYEKEFKVKIRNYAHYADEFYTNASNKVTSIHELSNPVIDAEVFTDAAKDKALTLDYGKYAIKFTKVSRQNTGLYLKAKTDVVDVENTKAIGSIGFKPTRVKDAATITMPISADNENYYGETVYVYAVVDGKPTGTAIKADVISHSYVVFNVPAGTTLGTFAAYGAQSLGDAEKPAAKTEKTNKPAIPETGV